MATRIWIFSEKERNIYENKHPKEPIPWGVAIPDGKDTESGIRPTRGADITIKHTVPEIMLFEPDGLMSVTFAPSGIKVVIGQDSLFENIFPESESDESHFQSSSQKGYMN